MEIKTVWHEVNLVAENLLNLYKSLDEFSELIEFKKGVKSDICAGDDLKFILVELMDEIQKLKPMDY